MVMQLLKISEYLSIVTAGLYTTETASMAGPEPISPSQSRPPLANSSSSSEAFIFLQTWLADRTGAHGWQSRRIPFTWLKASGKGPAITA